MSDLEQPPEWRELVEEWWIAQCQDIHTLVDAGLRDDFLLHTIWEPPRLSQADHHSLFAKFGIIHHYYHHWREDYEDIKTLLDGLDDPEWGGLGRWREMERSPVTDELPFSPTLIHKAAVLSRNLVANGVDPKTLSTVVHWGGGIGLQSMLMRWWGGRFTEYVVDLPVMSRVQYEYIGRNMGWDKVHLADTEVKEGVINIVPLSRLHLLPDECDVFLSLHAISESSVKAQDYVVGRDWFGADKILLEWTEGIFFEGTSHWAEIATGLEASGRIVPRDRVRGGFRAKWNGDTALLADHYREKYGVPVLRITRDLQPNAGHWTNMPLPQDWTTRDMDVLMELARPALPIIVVDVAYAATDRKRFELLKEHVAARRYRFEEHYEALVFIDKDLFP